MCKAFRFKTWGGCVLAQVVYHISGLSESTVRLCASFISPFVWQIFPECLICVWYQEYKDELNQAGLWLHASIKGNTGGTSLVIQ